MEAAGKVVIWFDLLNNSQYDTSAKAFDWLTGTFMNAIQTMGNVLMIITPRDNPIPLTRAWCVFELYHHQDEEPLRGGHDRRGER